MRAGPKNIAIIATLDTKGAEAGFLRERIEARSLGTIVIDPGLLGEPLFPGDISREEVARAGGEELGELIASGDKGRCNRAMTRGTCKVVASLYREGKLQGAIGLGGAQGTAIAATALQELPITVPKLVVSTVASGLARFGPFVGTKDMTMMHSVADILGLNSITRSILANAAGAIVGMVEAGAALPRPERPAVGMTIYGNTTPAGMRAKGILEERGYEVMAFHPNGTGGAAMEELIQQGFFKAILDLSTHELTDHLVGGDHAGRENRLTVAGAHGLPQVVLPGGIDFIITGPPEAIPQELRGRAYVQHSVYMCLVRTSREEMAEVGRRTAKKLNEALGPAKVIVPLRGFSYQGARGRPLHDTPSDMAYLEALREHLSPAIELIEMDHNINDPPVAERACEELLAMMRRALERKDA